ncbi:MAG: biopolymer transporter ExbD [Crocinitomicaceae bacterium]|nr:biopolymer transporter ExbD [Crocinitomicaceae bacterium]MDG1777538.1 biopolymer transporter ExbD [Crocinitomicaceae bacterium]
MDLGSKNKIKVEGGMASMTDLVFLLLIFFIIMSLMSNNQTPIDLPEAAESLPASSDPVEATVIITEDNRYVVMPGGSLDQPMDYEDIKAITAAVVESSGKMKLKVAGHRKASYEAVFNVLALSQANGWDPVLAYDK